MSISVQPQQEDVANYFCGKQALINILWRRISWHEEEQEVEQVSKEMSALARVIAEIDSRAAFYQSIGCTIPAVRTDRPANI